MTSNGKLAVAEIVKKKKETFKFIIEINKGM